MMRSLVLTVLTLFSVGCGALAVPAWRAPVGHQPEEEAAVLEALDRYMTAISAKDYATQVAMQAPQSMAYQWRPTRDGRVRIDSQPNAFWSDPARDDGRALRERYWDPSVMIRGGIAVVWAPYEFWIDGKTSHRGIDIVDFVKVDGEWIVANAMWTVELGETPELGPDAGSVMRPAD
jgi:hypothetical protein